MAKRPVQSLDTFGESLLAQQSTRRDKKAKQSRRREKRMMLLGALVAGQGIVNSALKRRAKEIADRGEFSKLRSKKQAENMSFYAPILDSISGHDSKEDWDMYMEKNPGELRALKGHLAPAHDAFAKQFLPAEAADPAKYAREYRHLINDNTNHLIEQAFGVDPESGMSFSELWKLGTAEFAEKSGVDPANREALNNLLANTTQNSVDAYKAREITAQNNNLSTSIFSKDTYDAGLQAVTFNAIKRNKRESSPFKKIDTGQGLLPQTMQQLLDGFGVRTIMKDRFTSQYAVMRDEVVAYSNSEASVTSMEKVWEAMPGRVKDGTFWDFHRLPGAVKTSWSERQGGHRFTRLRAGLMDDVQDFVNKDSNLAMREDLLQQAGTLAHMIGDPNRPKLKTSIMDQWLELPWVQELGITKGSADYRKVYGELDTLTGRQEFALDFVTSLSFKNEKVIGFEVDFSEIKSITGQKFRVVQDDTSGYKGAVFGKKRKLKFEPTDIYNSLNQTEKIRDYDTFLRGILENQTRSNNTTEGLKEVALKFIKDVPSPSGELTEEAINRIVGGSVDRANIPFDASRPWLKTSPEAIMPPPEDEGSFYLFPEDTVEPLAVDTIQLIDSSTLTPHRSMNQEQNLIPIMDYHLDAINNNGTPRLVGDKDKNKAIMVNQFIPAVFDTESDFEYNAKNSKSSAYGGGQIVRTSLIPALNRLNKAGVKPEEEQLIRENMSRIDSVLDTKRNELVAQGMTDETAIKSELEKLGRIEYFKFMDKANLAETLQQQLVLADLLEKKMRNEEGVATTGVGDTLWNDLFEASTPEAQYRAALEIYYRGHHTKPDKDTRERAEKMFRPYFF